MSVLRPELERELELRWPGAAVERLAGDASTRQFLRVRVADGESWVVMDYGEPFADETDDVRLHRVFRAAGLPVAGILAKLPWPGCLVLEDLGDLTVEAAASADPARLPGLLEQATRLALAIAARGTGALERSDRSAGPALDASRFRFEMEFFLEHYVAGLLGHADPPEGLRDELHRLADRSADTPRKVLCHRDFHSRNLMVGGDGELRMVDIQDARWGPDTYDFASLLYDPYLDIPGELRDRLGRTFRDARPGISTDPEFLPRFRLVACQRMIKALGTFGHQATVRGRRGYLSSVPRTLARLDALLPEQEATARLHELFSRIDLFTPRFGDSNRNS